MDQLKVFISYRRADTSHVAGRLGDRVGARFSLFMDIDDIRPGTDFTAVVRQAVDESDVLLVLIGPHYLDADTDGVRRLDKSGDWVAEEVATGLARDITVVPVLVDGTPMPAASDLPQQLQALSRRQAFNLTHASFNSDAERLMGVLAAIEQTAIEQTAATRTATAQTASEQTATEPTRSDQGQENEDEGRAAEPDAPAADLFSDPDYARAIAAAFHHRWAQAIQLFEGLDRRFPADDRITRPLGDARESFRLEQLDADATAAEADQRWRVAATALAELTVARPDDAGFAQRLATVRREVSVEDLTHELRALYTAEEWAGVGVLSQRIAEIDPARADPDGLTARAAENLVEQRLAAAYAKSLSAHAEGRPTEALAGLLAVQQERPGFREVDDLVAMLRAELAKTSNTKAVSAPAVVEPTAPPAPPDPAATAADKATTPSESAPPGLAAGRGIGWVVLLAAVLLIAIQVPLHPYEEQSLATVVRILVASVVCFVAVAVLLIRDARHLAPDRRRVLAWCTVGVAVAAVVVRQVVWSVTNALINDGMALDALWGVWGVLVPGVAGGVVYAVLRRWVGRWAVWPALLGVFAFLVYGFIRLVPLYISS